MTRTWLLLALLIARTAPAGPITIERESLPGPDRMHARFRLQASMDRVLGALEIPCAVRSWLPGADELEILERDGHRTRVRIYTRFPWPWRDRLAHLQFVRHERDDQVVIAMEALPKSMDTDAVEVTQSTARWSLTPDDSDILVRYQQRFNPGGTVPQWLADSLAESRVADALENLAALVEGRRTLADCNWTDVADERKRADPAGVP